MVEKEFNIAFAALEQIGHALAEKTTPYKWPCIECANNVEVPFIEYKGEHRKIRRRKDCAKQHGMIYMQNRIRSGKENSCFDFKQKDSEDLDIYPL